MVTVCRKSCFTLRTFEFVLLPSFKMIYIKMIYMHVCVPYQGVGGKDDVDTLMIKVRFSGESKQYFKMSEFRNFSVLTEENRRERDNSNQKRVKRSYAPPWHSSRVDTDVLMEVAYSCNFLAVSDSSTFLI